MRVKILICVALLAIASCGGDDADEPATTARVAATSSDPARTSAAPSGTPVPTVGATTSTTTSTSSTTTVAPTTTTEPLPSAGEAFIEAFAQNDLAPALGMTAPGSAAYVYVEGLMLLPTDGMPSPPRITPIGEGSWQLTYTDGSLTFGDIVLDVAGLVTDLSRQGKPLSATVVPMGATFTDDEHAPGLVGTVHSVRYFDGDLQAIVTTANNSDVDGWLDLGDVVINGQQYYQALSNDTHPGVTRTYMQVWEDVPAPTAGATFYGTVWADNSGWDEVELAVTPLG